MADVYRRAASVVLLRPGARAAEYEVLLLKKPRKRDAWQLPQGGVEAGETLLQAGLRELREEAGLRDVMFLGVSRRTYRYDFPPSFRRFRPDNVRGQSVGFVFALAERSATVRVDGREIESSAWVSPDELLRSIRRKEYLDAVTELVEEAKAIAENRLNSA